jgi:hypothetical protein
MFWQENERANRKCQMFHGFFHRRMRFLLFVPWFFFYIISVAPGKINGTGIVIPA